LKQNDSFPGRHLIGVLDCHQLTPSNSKTIRRKIMWSQFPLEGRVAQLILLVIASVCIVFCVLCSNQRPDDCTFFFSGRNFFQFCNNWCLYFDRTYGYLRFISTVGKTTVPFFLQVVIFPGCNLNPQKTWPARRLYLYFFLVVIFSGQM
jgi:hypothetical protein